jgi:hypothetical protein
MPGFVANDNVIELSGLRAELQDEYINDAVVTVIIEDADGAVVTGPLQMPHVAGSDGVSRDFTSHTPIRSQRALRRADRRGRWHQSRWALGILQQAAVARGEGRRGLT